MALKVTKQRYSDAGGALIPEGTGARVRVMFFDSSKPDRRADLTDEEVEDLLIFAQEVESRPERRGREYSRFDPDSKRSKDSL